MKMTKNIYDFIRLPMGMLLILLCAFSGMPSLAQNTEKKKTAPAVFLDGKTFSINIYTLDPDGKSVWNAAPDEITFRNGKFYSVKMGKEYGYTSDTYQAKADSAKSDSTTTFIAFSRNQDGAVEIFWNGTVTGNSIKGSMHWFSEGKTKMFSGRLKDENKAK